MLASPNYFIKSPLNYIGGKYKILPQIIPLFPSRIRCFVDLFAGGLNVGLNVPAEKIIANDIITYLVDFYASIQTSPIEAVFTHIYERIKQYGLSLQNEEGYRKLRETYNINRDPMDLFVLASYSFNHQIRFNNAHKFNNPFGRNRSRYNTVIEENLRAFIIKLHKTNIEFRAKDFNDFDLSFLKGDDFVYCDPPYLISRGVYNDGKRGFSGWGKDKERTLLDILDKRGIPFALSNVLLHKGSVNEPLAEWASSNRYYVTEIMNDYSNASYQVKIRDKKATREVLITNYRPVTHLAYMLPFSRQA
ncbi:MAG: DNA adenine methylase [Candidatus Tokpelaia sp.]|nr:MAG: DNA adenine methylase [Candidatus Tokpelaia sp.]KAA6207328.1 MAG: DNA adenine methylase [Candidatus Tokpelaia sp.]